MEFNLMKYILDQRRIGKDDKQIATSLGMSLKHFHSLVSGKAEERKAKVEEKKQKHEKQKAEFKGWRDEGVSNAQIAEKANIAEATILNVIKVPTETVESESYGN